MLNVHVYIIFMLVQGQLKNSFTPNSMGGANAMISKLFKKQLISRIYEVNCVSLYFLSHELNEWRQLSPQTASATSIPCLLVELQAAFFKWFVFGNTFLNLVLSWQVWYKWTQSVWSQTSGWDLRDHCGKVHKTKASSKRNCSQAKTGTLLLGYVHPIITVITPDNLWVKY